MFVPHFDISEPVEDSGDHGLLLLDVLADRPFLPQVVVHDEDVALFQRVQQHVLDLGLR